MEKPNQYPLPRFSVNRPVTVVMSLVALLVVGYIAYTRIPLTLFPEGFDYPRLFAWASYPNAGAVEVEQKVVRHLEEAVAQVSRVKNIRSSAYSGGGNVRVEFQKGTDLQLAFAEMKDRLDRVMPELPDEIEQLWVRRWDQNDIPIMDGAIIFETQHADPRHLIDTYVEPALRRVDGVGNIELWGSPSKQVIVELDRDKMHSHRINVFEALNSLRAQNLTVPGGWVIEGGKKIYVRSVGRFQDVAELANTVVDPAHQLRLDDIAEVSYKRPEQDWVNRINRKESLGFGVTKASGANVVEVSTGVKEELEKLKDHPKLEGLDFKLFWNQGDQVINSVGNLKNSGLWGGLFAAIVLFFFLRAVRITLIITLAIPLSLLTTIIALYFIGWSLNVATMMGLMLSLGLVVDNAIVIVENIYRKRQEGIAPRTASIDGSRRGRAGRDYGDSDDGGGLPAPDSDERRGDVFVLDAQNRPAGHHRTSGLAAHRPDLYPPRRTQALDEKGAGRGEDDPLVPQALYARAELGAEQSPRRLRHRLGPFCQHQDPDGMAWIAPTVRSATRCGWTWPLRCLRANPWTRPSGL